MKEFTFEERGICYRTNEFQAGRPTLVFIHGLSGSASAWFSYEKMFSEKYNLLTFDLRGHGKSRKLKRYEDYSLEKSADDVYELLNYLHIEQCVLVSHSYGTLVALEFLQAHQERISRAIFLSPTSFLEHTKWYWITKTVGRALVALYDLLPFHPVIRGRVDYSPYKHTGDWELRRVLSDLRMTSVRAYLNCLVQAYARDYDLMWKNVRVPTLIVHGTKDSMIPVQNSVRLAKEIPGSKLVLLEGANHVIVLNNIKEVSEQIEKFSD